MEEDHEENEHAADTGLSSGRKRLAQHPKYGTGTVVSEDEMMVEVEFENYGKKQFVKAFSGLTFL